MCYPEVMLLQIADRGGGIVPGGGPLAAARTARGAGGRQGGDGEAVCRGGRPDGRVRVVGGDHCCIRWAL